MQLLLDLRHVIDESAGMTQAKNTHTVVHAVVSDVAGGVMDVVVIATVTVGESLRLRPVQRCPRLRAAPCSGFGS